jgi:yersiniabactin nonribosomal peptide synthetase
VVAVLGVLSVGAVYVPVGPEQPEQRRLRILDNAGVVLVIDEALLEQTARLPPLPQIAQINNAALAYVIYTSGSTGEPKGVEVTHRAAMNTIDAINDRYGVGGEDRVLTVSALDFDLSVYDLFGLLTAGGAVVVLEEGWQRDARHWAAQVRRHGVTIWNSVPALLEMLLTATGGGDLASLRVVLLGGDWVAADLPGRLARHAPDCRFAALGGATEAAIHSTVCEVAPTVPAWPMMPYGVSMANVRCRVVDQRGRDCPDWVVGELWIGGAGVAAGYRGNPDATAERFVVYQGERWYRTGDLGRYWPDGVLEFLGRADFQVKIRGHRIELGEIEAALKQHPQVREAVAVAFGDGGQRLGAAVVGPLEDTGCLNAHLAPLLPRYMMPERIVALDEIPLSANGKVDRKRIAQRVASSEATVAIAEPPYGEIERRLAQLWSQLLSKANISRHDNFFALGGDSLLATKLAQQARQRLGIELPLQAIFASSTLAELAAVLSVAELESEEGLIE